MRRLPEHVRLLWMFWARRSPPGQFLRRRQVQSKLTDAQIRGELELTGQEAPALDVNRPGFVGGSDVSWVRWCRHTWFQATGWVDWCSSSNSIGVRIPRAEWRRSRLWKTSR